ncbi:hypothetical protein [Streptomyces sp. G1]|nr:hypothetical protein [Streptomyces sp. G1]MCM1964905.1 hypothetical protein [Streptomyces sp. G1]
MELLENLARLVRTAVGWGWWWTPGVLGVAVGTVWLSLAAERGGDGDDS